jgi:hypothetical protein
LVLARDEGQNDDEENAFTNLRAHRGRREASFVVTDQILVARVTGR